MWEMRTGRGDYLLVKSNLIVTLLELPLSGQKTAEALEIGNPNNLLPKLRFVGI